MDWEEELKVSSGYSHSRPERTGSGQRAVKCGLADNYLKSGPTA